MNLRSQKWFTKSLKWTIKLKKICFVIESMQGGGAQKNLYYLINTLRKNKNKIYLLTFSNKTKDIFIFSKDIQRSFLPLEQNSISFLKKISNNLKRLKSLRKFFNEKDFDIVISFLTTTNILTIISTLGLRSKVIISERNDPKRQEINFFWRILRNFFYKYCDLLTFNSKNSRDYFLKICPNHKVKYIPNFVYVMHKKPLKRKRKFMLAVGRLHIQKGFDILIKAFSIFFKNNKNYDLIILGAGDERKNLEKKIKELKLENNIFLPGYLNPYPYYNACSLYISSSRYEGVSNATLEAMQYKVPIIITDTQIGMFDYLKDNHSALFASTTPESLAEKIKIIIDSKKIKKKISLNAYNSINKVDNKKIEEMWVKEIY